MWQTHVQSQALAKSLSDGVLKNRPSLRPRLVKTMFDGTKLHEEIFLFTRQLALSEGALRTSSFNLPRNYAWGFPQWRLATLNLFELEYKSRHFDNSLNSHGFLRFTLSRNGTESLILHIGSGTPRPLELWRHCWQLWHQRGFSPTWGNWVLHNQLQRWEHLALHMQLSLHLHFQVHLALEIWLPLTGSHLRAYFASSGCRLRSRLHFRAHLALSNLRIPVNSICLFNVKHE